MTKEELIDFLTWIESKAMYLDNEHITVEEQVDAYIKSLNSLPHNETSNVVSNSFSAKDMENFAAKCMILGSSGKTTMELLKDFCDNDR